MVPFPTKIHYGKWKRKMANKFTGYSFTAPFTAHGGIWRAAHAMDKRIMTHRIGKSNRMRVWVR